MRTLLVAAVGVPFTVAAAMLYILLCLIRPVARGPMAVERAWAAAMLRLAGVELSARGTEHLRPGESYVVMPNHRSWFDIPVLFLALAGRDVRWVGKKEIVPVPFFGWAFRVSRHVVIDRGDREKAVRAIRRAAALGGRGVSVLIFPEGTRSPTPELLPLKKGGFHLAIEAGLPILPVAIEGTEWIMPKRAWRIRPGRVRVTFLAPEPPPRTQAGLPGAAARVGGRIAATLGGHPATPLPQEVR
ncbi:MAG: lysophospholipid acyltransferase family protein [Gemmatimonadota bacterium]